MTKKVRAMRTQYDKEIKKMKKAMYSCKCDKAVVKSWLKSYEKTLKNKDKIIRFFALSAIYFKKFLLFITFCDNIFQS